MACRWARSGSIDPGVLLYLLHDRRLDVVDLENLIWRESGLLGVSGLSSDMRVLLESDRPAARDAVDLFVYRVGLELGALASALGGLDALVFTAGIGEHAPAIRARVCQAAAWLGVELDEAANESKATRITTATSRVQAWVVPTNEELMIARHIARAWLGRVVRHEASGSAATSPPTRRARSCSRCCRGTARPDSTPCCRCQATCLASRRAAHVSTEALSAPSLLPRASRTALTEHVFWKAIAALTVRVIASTRSMRG
jgi:hypothetical protein